MNLFHIFFRCLSRRSEERPVEVPVLYMVPGLDAGTCKIREWEMATRDGNQWNLWNKNLWKRCKYKKKVKVSSRKANLDTIREDKLEDLEEFFEIFEKRFGEIFESWSRTRWLIRINDLPMIDSDLDC